MKKVKKIYHIAKSWLKPRAVPIVTTVDKQGLLAGKVALIAGGGGGIGSAIASSFAKAGAKVIITGRSAEKLKKCCEKIGGDAEYIVLDQLNVESFEKKVKEAAEKFGRIDILVNCSGTHIERSDAEFLNVTEKEYDQVMDLNLKGAYFLAQAAAQYFVKNKITNAHILLISSSRGSEPAWSPYGISKNGLNAMTKGLARVLAKHGIIVNAIAPGPTATGLIAYKEGDTISTDDNLSGRLTMPEEVAEYAKILCSDLGEMTTGETIHVSGGRGVADIR